MSLNRPLRIFLIFLIFLFLFFPEWSFASQLAKLSLEKSTENLGDGSILIEYWSDGVAGEGTVRCRFTKHNGEINSVTVVAFGNSQELSAERLKELNANSVTLDNLAINWGTKGFNNPEGPTVILVFPKHSIRIDKGRPGESVFLTK